MATARNGNASLTVRWIGLIVAVVVGLGSLSTGGIKLVQHGDEANAQAIGQNSRRINELEVSYARIDESLKRIEWMLRRALDERERPQRCEEGIEP